MPNRRKILISMGGAVALAGCSEDNPEFEQSDVSEGEETDGPPQEPEEGEMIEPAVFELSEVSTPDQPLVGLAGATVVIFVEIRNTGGEVGTTTIEATIGQTQKSEDIEVEPNNTRDLRFEFENLQPGGMYTVELSESDGESSVTTDFEVHKPEVELSYEINDVQFIDQEETVEINIENLTEMEVLTEVLFELSSVNFSEHIALAPNETKTLRFDYTVPSTSGLVNAQFAETAGETVISQEVDVAQLEEVIEVSVDHSDGFECSLGTVTGGHGNLGWLAEVSTLADLPGRGFLNLKLEFIDEAGRLVGAIRLEGEAPTPDTPVVWGMGARDLDNDDCEHVERISNSLDGDGHVRVSDASH